MILLNKFMFGDLDKFKKDLSTNRTLLYATYANLLKKLFVYYGRKNAQLHYRDKKLFVSESCISFTNEMFIKHKNGEHFIRFMYEKIYNPNGYDVYIEFRNIIDSRICGLALRTNRCFNIFPFSDDKSIENVMKILRH